MSSGESQVGRKEVGDREGFAGDRLWVPRHGGSFWQMSSETGQIRDVGSHMGLRST